MLHGRLGLDTARIPHGDRFGLLYLERGVLTVENGCLRPAVLRGIEGARMKETYRLMAARFGVPWHGRRYDRANPSAADPANQAINHTASAVEAAACIAVAATATIPQLGFIHEDSGQSFVLDIADLFRVTLPLPVAFEAAKRSVRQPDQSIERLTRRLAGTTLQRDAVIPMMIERIKSLFGEEG